MQLGRWVDWAASRFDEGYWHAQRLSPEFWALVAVTAGYGLYRWLGNSRSGPSTWNG